MNCMISICVFVNYLKKNRKQDYALYVECFSVVYMDIG